VLSELPPKPLPLAPLSAERVPALAPPELVFEPPAFLPALAPLLALLESPAELAGGEELDALQAASPELMVSVVKRSASDMRFFMGALEGSTAATSASSRSSATRLTFL